MKKLAFDTLTNVSYLTLALLAWLAEILPGLLEGFLVLTRSLLAALAVYLLRLVDADRFDSSVAEEEAQVALERQARELELLSAATKLKEDAVKKGEWTEEDSEALTEIANALLNECDWDEPHIHQYLKEAVESGTDLSYGVEFEDDDED
jgi:hypothetical protein